MLLVASFRPATLRPTWFGIFLSRPTPVCGVYGGIEFQLESPT